MKNLLLLPILLLSLASFSQDTVKIPTHVGRQIVKDLLDYESVKLQLNLCKEQVDLTNKKCQAKDTIIINYKSKVENCENRILLEKEKVELYKRETVRLEKEYKKLKLKLTLTQIGSGALIGTLAYLLVKK